MTSSLDAALSGMLEHQRQIELIANNLANVNTTGYKRASVHFKDVLSTVEIVAALNGELAPANVATASGVESSTVQRLFEQGPLQPTTRDLDFAISGDGFFQVLLDDGSTAYTRDGTFRLGGDGRLVTADGKLVSPPVTLPPVFSDLKVESTGVISLTRPLSETELAALGPDDPRDGVREEVGTIELVRFAFPSALESIGTNLFRETPESQPPIPGEPGVDGMGQIVSGFVEASNVQVADEMTSMVMASRAYQLNLNAYRTIEEMLRRAHDLAS